jgi:hypothetical protein
MPGVLIEMPAPLSGAHLICERPATGHHDYPANAMSERRKPGA